MKFSNSNSGNYSNEEREVPPAKTYPARVVGIYDIGKQPGFNPEDPAKPQVVFVYELLGKERMADGNTFQVSEFLTVSLHAKATLPRRLKVFGAPIKKKSDDWFDVPEDFSLVDCIGEPCMLEVQHNTKGNAKVGNAIEPIEGMTIPEATKEVGFVDLDADDWMDHYENAPKWIKNRIDDQVK
jgi:hypothetical protein